MGDPLAHVDALLARTLTGAAGRGGAAVERYADAPDARPLRRGRALFHDAPDDQPVRAGSAVWSLWLDDDPARGLDVTCKVPSDDPEVIAHELCVCTEVAWGALHVTLDGREHALPLDAAHLVSRARLVGGALDDGPWGPAARLDVGLAQGFAWRVGDALVVAAAELFGHRAAPAWDPWGLLLAARLRPHLALAATAPLDAWRASVTLTRPPGTVMVGCTADQEGRFRAAAEGEHRAALLRFRDGATSPRWDDALDDVALAVSPAEALALDPARAAHAAPPALRRRLDDDGALVAEALPRPALPGRGDWDAAVVAPWLRGDVALAAALPGWRLDPVAPLPVGAHDALHVVWRWGAEAPDDEGQRVTVRCEGARVTYEARATRGLPVGEMAVVMRRGAAFGLALEPGAHASGDAAEGLPAGFEAPRDAAWWRHWRMRYCASPKSGPLERLQRVAG